MSTQLDIHHKENGRGTDAPFADETSVDEASADYLQDDIARGLRASLVEVLSSTLGDEAHPDFLKGVLSLARRQADLYGIPWHEMMQSLCTMPELCGLISQLQECTLQGPAPPPANEPPAA